MNKQKQNFEPILDEIKSELKELRRNYNVVGEKVENASELEKLERKN